MDNEMSKKTDESTEEIRKELADIKSILSEILAAQATMDHKKDNNQNKSLQELADIFFKQAEQIGELAKKITEPEKKTQYLKNTLSTLREIKEAIKEFPLKIAEAIKAKSFNLVDKALNSIAAKLDNGAKYLQSERDRIISMSPLEKTAEINNQDKIPSGIKDPAETVIHQADQLPIEDKKTVIKENDFYASYVECENVEERYIKNYKNNEKFFYRQEDADKQFILDELKFHGTGLKEATQILQKNSPKAENNPAYAKEVTLELMQSSTYKELLANTKTKEPELSR